MKREKEIYAKHEQIRIIDVILSSLCSTELSNDGRKLLKKIKKKLSLEIIILKKNRLVDESINSNKVGYSLEHSL